MSNANEPAYPVECTRTDSGLVGVQTGPSRGWATGLTKRELIAAMALQGFAANGNEQIAQWWPEKMVHYSIVCADHLLSELAKAQP